MPSNGLDLNFGVLVFYICFCNNMLLSFKGFVIYCFVIRAKRREYAFIFMGMCARDLISLSKFKDRQISVKVYWQRPLLKVWEIFTSPLPLPFF